MKTIVVGDIGGHFSVLDRILEHVNIDSDFQLPQETCVLQVGDLVRAHPKFRRQNTRIVETVQKILQNNPDKWIQLIGNHEVPLLGGARKSDWNTEEAYEPACAEIVNVLWTTGQLRLAASLEHHLVTHAGLTAGYWKRIGKPETAHLASERLNKYCGKPVNNFLDPGRLVTDRVNISADVVWAEVNDELITPWMENGDMPFNQIHGHASPFHWNDNQWWPETPESIKRITTVNPSLRRSQTRLKTGRTFTSVDWNLESKEPKHLWPLLEIESFVK